MKNVHKFCVGVFLVGSFAWGISLYSVTEVSEGYESKRRLEERKGSLEQERDAKKNKITELDVERARLEREIAAQRQALIAQTDLHLQQQQERGGPAQAEEEGQATGLAQQIDSAQAEILQKKQALVALLERSGELVDAVNAANVKLYDIEVKLTTPSWRRFVDAIAERLSQFGARISTRKRNASATRLMSLKDVRRAISSVDRRLQQDEMKLRTNRDAARQAARAVRGEYNSVEVNAGFSVNSSAPHWLSLWRIKLEESITIRAKLQLNDPSVLAPGETLKDLQTKLNEIKREIQALYKQIGDQLEGQLSKKQRHALSRARKKIRDDITERAVAAEVEALRARHDYNTFNEGTPSRWRVFRMALRIRRIRNVTALAERLNTSETASATVPWAKEKGYLKLLEAAVDGMDPNAVSGANRVSLSLRLSELKKQLQAASEQIGSSFNTVSSAAAVLDWYGKSMQDRSEGRAATEILFDNLGSDYLGNLNLGERSAEILGKVLKDLKIEGVEDMSLKELKYEMIKNVYRYLELDPKKSYSNNEINDAFQKKLKKLQEDPQFDDKARLLWRNLRHYVATEPARTMRDAFQQRLERGDEQAWGNAVRTLITQIERDYPHLVDPKARVRYVQEASDYNAALHEVISAVKAQQQAISAAA